MLNKNSKYVLIIYLMSLLDLLAVGLTFPLLFPHLKSIGASNYVIGIFGAVYSGLQIFSGPLIGSWSDVRGCKFVLIITLSISSCCYFLCGITNSLGLLFLFRIILGITKHTQTLCKVLIMDLIPKENYTKVFARSVSIGSLGFVIGPMIGGHIIMLDNGFFHVCVLTALLFIINIGLAINIPCSLKENKYQSGGGLINFKRELMKMFFELNDIEWKHFWDVFLLRFLYGLSISIFFANQSLFIEEKFKVTKVFIGYTISFLSGIGVISGFLFKNINNLNIIIYVYISFALTLLGINFTQDLYTYFILLVPFSICNTFLRITTMELILLKALKYGRKGSLSGISNSIMSVGRFLSPLTIGLSNNLIFDQNIAPVIAFVPSFIACLLCKNIVDRKYIKNKSI